MCVINITQLYTLRYIYWYLVHENLFLVITHWYPPVMPSWVTSDCFIRGYLVTNIGNFDVITGLLVQTRSSLEQECFIKVLAEIQAQLDKQQSLMQQVKLLETQLSHGILYCIRVYVLITYKSVCVNVCVYIYSIHCFYVGHKAKQDSACQTVSYSCTNTVNLPNLIPE